MYQQQTADPEDALTELATIFARGYLRLLEQHAGERQRVNQQGGERRLDVPGEESLHGPAVNTTANANPNREGGSHEHGD